LLVHQFYFDRFTEIAVGDLDEETQTEMLSALRIMQKRGLLDVIHEEKLDDIDQVRPHLSSSFLFFFSS